MNKNDTDILNDFSAKLKAQRTKMNISIRQAAAKCSISPTYYLYLESGQRKGISLTKAAYIATQMELEITIHTKT